MASETDNDEVIFDLTGGYRCRKCGADVTIPCPPRKLAEPIKDYVERLAAYYGQHHDQIAPACRPDRLDLKVPMTQQGIGVPGEKLSEMDKEDLARIFQKPDGGEVT